MKIKPLLSNIDSKTFLFDYLQAKGVQDVGKYLAPSKLCFDSPWEYPNMEIAVESLVDSLERDDIKYGILVDCDVDGMCSAAVIYNFLCDQSIDMSNTVCFFHQGKEHGLRKSIDENIVEQILKEKINYLIVPDAGSNDVDECKELAFQGIQVLILDHHEIVKDNPYAIIVNHHLGNGLNEALSGTGVVYKFVQALWEHLGYETTPYYDELVAISLISDVCDLSSLENRAFLDKLQKRMMDYDINPMINTMLTKLCRNHEVNPHTISWGCVPPINALCRGDNQEDKITFFKALVGLEKPEEGLKVARRAHRNQVTQVKAIMEEIEPTLDTTHKVIVGYTKAEYKNYTGLVANKIMAIYGKPVILLRDMNSTTYSGSLRSIIPLASRINESKLAQCQGHEEACGILVKKSNLNKLLKWFDNLNLSTNPEIPVTAILMLHEIDTDLCNICLDNKMLWGHGLEEPTFYTKIYIDPSKIQFFKKATTTIKFTVDSVDFIKFSASKEDVENFERIVNCNNSVTIELIVTLSMNEWNGNFTKQCLIEKYEIDWSSLEEEEEDRF